MKLKFALPLAIAPLMMASCTPTVPQITSPNQAISLKLSTQGDSLYYTVRSGDSEIISPSFMNLLVDSLQLGVEVTTIQARSVVREAEYLQQDFLVKNRSGHHFTLQVRAYDTGVAFRYLYELVQRSSLADQTNFVIPSGKTLWAQDNLANYEGAHRKYSSGELSTGKRFGPPVTIEYGDEIYASITEGGLHDFAGMHLMVNAPNRMVTQLHSDSYLEGAAATPWRVVIVGNLNDLVNSPIMRSTASPMAKIFEGNTDWIKPGRSAWSWLAGYGVTFENMKKFTQWASELGFEYNLVDEGWSYWNEDGKGDWELLAELVAYGQERGVRTLLWKAYPDRGGVEGLQTEERTRAFFQKCKDTGIAGVKIDFFDSESQEVMRYMARTLEIAAEYELVVNYHGCTKPVGFEYTYPNELTREGILGLEYGRSWSDQNTVTPFTRFVAGHADYTTLSFTPSFMGETTRAHQIASAIVFTSPLMCYGGNPQDFINAPEKEFIMAIPTVWDETRVLPPSKIGETVVFARRSGEEWFVGVLGENPQAFELSLDFLGEGTYLVERLTDEGLQSQSKVTCSEVLPLSLLKAGGFAAIFRPLK